MNLRFIGLFVSVATNFLFAATAVAAPGTTVYRLQRHSGSVCQLEMPGQWEWKEGDSAFGFPTLVFTPASGGSLMVVITPMWETESSGPYMPEQRMKEFVDVFAEETKAIAMPGFDVQRIRGQFGTGYAFTAIQRAPELDEFISTTQGMFLVGRFALLFMIVSNEGQAAERTAALDVIKHARTVEDGRLPQLTVPGQTASSVKIIRLYEWVDENGTKRRSALFPFLRPADSGDSLSPSPVTKPEAPSASVYARLPVPHEGIAIEFPLAEFELEIADLTVPYFYITNPRTGLNVSFNFEPVVACENSRECRDFLAQVEGQFWPPGFRRAEIGDVSVAEFVAANGEIGQIKQFTMFAQFVRNGCWVDAHLSKVQYRESDHSLFESFVRSVRLVDDPRLQTPSNEPSGKPETAPGPSMKEDVEADVIEAIRAMRGVDESSMDSNERELKAREFAAAWSVIQVAGPIGVTALKQELQQLSTSGTRDDFFRLAAAALLWKAAGVQEAETVASIWSSDIDFAVNDLYVLPTALDAARTRSPAVLPMLTAILRWKNESVSVPPGNWRTDADSAKVLIWHAFGPAGTQALLRLLDTPTDDTTLISVMRMLTARQELEALPRIRELVGEGSLEVRNTALLALGNFGHPQDFAILTANLRADSQHVNGAIEAIGLYEDPRAVRRLIPLLESDNEQTRRLTLDALTTLATPAAVSALERESRINADESRRTQASLALESILEPLATTYSAFAELPESGQREMLVMYYNRRNSRHRMRATDQPLSHPQWLAAAEEWIQLGRTHKGQYDWVRERHVVDVAVPNDFPLMLDLYFAVGATCTKSSFRESMEVADWLQHVGRSRYRDVAGEWTIDGLTKADGAIR